MCSVAGYYSRLLTTPCRLSRGTMPSGRATVAAKQSAESLTNGYLVADRWFPVARDDQVIADSLVGSLVVMVSNELVERLTAAPRGETVGRLGLGGPDRTLHRRHSPAWRRTHGIRVGLRDLLVHADFECMPRLSHSMGRSTTNTCTLTTRCGWSCCSNKVQRFWANVLCSYHARQPRRATRDSTGRWRSRSRAHYRS